MTTTEKQLVQQIEGLLSLQKIIMIRLSGIDTVDEYTGDVVFKKEPEIFTTMGEMSMIIQRFANAEDFINELKSQSNENFN